jgi:hypothetical protein
MLTNLLFSLFDFIKEHRVIIVTIVVLVILVAFVYSVTTKSLKKLKPQMFSSYPFDLFFPHEGRWSVGYFFVLITFLTILVLLLLKGGFYVGPA